MADDSTDLFGKIITPVVVLVVIGMAVEKAFGFVYVRYQAFWEWGRAHQTTLIWILITLGSVLIGANVLKRYFPRVWKGMKIGCGILFLISIAGIVLFLIHKA